MSDLIKRARKAAGSIAVDHEVSVLLRELADALEKPTTFNRILHLSQQIEICRRLDEDSSDARKP